MGVYNCDDMEDEHTIKPSDWCDDYESCVLYIRLSSDYESYIDKIYLFTGFSHFKDGKNINISCYSL